MAKNRSKRLNGLPSEHARKAVVIESRIEGNAKEVRHAIRNGDCRGAFSSILASAENYAMASAHASESSGKVALFEGTSDTYRDLVTEFRQSCLRKPGLLDRFRRKKG